MADQRDRPLDARQQHGEMVEIGGERDLVARRCMPVAGQVDGDDRQARPGEQRRQPLPGPAALPGAVD
jgi:hypothetical protein